MSIPKVSKPMITTQRRRTRGFTFLEIMFVVVIIGILLALVGPRLVGRSQTARIQATNTQVRNIVTALNLYETHMGSFPDSSTGLKGLLEKPSSDDNDSWDGPYLDTNEIPKDSWGQEFNYKFPGEKNPKGFDVWSNGPDKQAGTPDDIGNWRVSKR